MLGHQRGAAFCGPLVGGRQTQAVSRARRNQNASRAKQGIFAVSLIVGLLVFTAPALRADRFQPLLIVALTFGYAWVVSNTADGYYDAHVPPTQRR